MAGDELVVGGIVDAPEAQRRPALVPLGGVIEDDIQDHLDPGVVQRRDHGLELVDLASG